MAKLGDVFSVIRNGASIRQADGTGGLPITRIETISNRKIDRSKFGYAGIEDTDKYLGYILQDMDILMSHINSEKHLGKVALYKKLGNEKIIHGMNLLMLRANKSFVYPPFATYFFETNIFLGQIKKITKKSVNQASFTVTALKEIVIDLPPLDEQRKIAAVLDKVSDLIAKRRQQLDKLDLLIKSKFVEMFGTLLHPSRKFKYDMLKNLCRKITDGKHGGCTPQLGSERYFVGAREIFNDAVHYETAQEIDVDEFEKDYKRCNVEIGDLLIVNTGATIGKSAIACDSRTQHTLLQKSVALLKVKTELINPVFLKYCYRVNETMYKVESASAQPNLLLSKINTTSIYVPPIKLQNQFAAFVEQTEKSKEIIKQSLEKLETLKKALMQEYFG